MDQKDIRDSKTSLSFVSAVGNGRRYKAGYIRSTTAVLFVHSHRWSCFAATPLSLSRLPTPTPHLTRTNSHTSQIGHNLLYRLYFLFIIPDYQNFNQMPDFRLVPGTSVMVPHPSTPDLWLIAYHCTTFNKNALTDCTVMLELPVPLKSGNILTRCASVSFSWKTPSL